MFAGRKGESNGRATLTVKRRGRVERKGIGPAAIRQKRFETVSFAQVAQLQSSSPAATNKIDDEIPGRRAHRSTNKGSGASRSPKHVEACAGLPLRLQVKPSSDDEEVDKSEELSDIINFLIETDPRRSRESCGVLDVSSDDTERSFSPPPDYAFRSATSAPSQAKGTSADAKGEASLRLVCTTQDAEMSETRGSEGTGDIPVNGSDPRCFEAADKKARPITAPLSDSAVVHGGPVASANCDDGCAADNGTAALDSPAYPDARPPCAEEDSPAGLNGSRNDGDADRGSCASKERELRTPAKPAVSPAPNASSESGTSEPASSRARRLQGRITGIALGKGL
ncbi:hypothetical protein MTO96_023473 [Rhipicephalus appendiculatus]